MNIEDFYKENYSTVFGFLFSLCGDPHLAEDLTSETFLRAIQKINAYDGRVKPATWLCTIGKHLYFNEVRRRRHANLEDFPIPSGDTPEDQLLEVERLRLILRFAAELEEPKNQVFRMRIQGMRFREIGNALGKTENWARITFFRAKEKIQKRLEESE